MPKLPFLKFYPGDWLRDPVSGCSLAAQGLWLRMMFLMHDGDRYGYLSTNGSPIPPGSVAQRCGCTLEQYETLLAELSNAGVPSRLEDGTILSRRMVKDESKRQKFSRLGKLGGNPTLNPPDKRSLTSEYDFSYPENLRTEEFKRAWLSWVEYRADMRKPLNLHMVQMQLKQLSRLGPMRSIRMIDNTIFKGWQGLREPELRKGEFRPAPDEQRDQIDKQQRARSLELAWAWWNSVKLDDDQRSAWRERAKSAIPHGNDDAWTLWAYRNQRAPPVSNTAA
jgi:hypothetical protein